MRLNPGMIAVAAASSLVTLCATIAVMAIVGTLPRERELTDAQRTEIARIVRDQTRDGTEQLIKSIREQGFSDSQRNEIGRVAREHLRSNPEVMQEILAELLKRRMASAPPTTSARPATPDKSEIIKKNAMALFHSKHQVTLGNAQGDVTLVEFFDYNCGYCRRSLSDKLALLKEDLKLRFVIKEFPILGPASLEAARVSIAVRMQDPGGEKFLEFHRQLLASGVRANKAKAMAVAESLGLDIARLEKDMESEEVTWTVEESRVLTQALGISGTPAYVVGNRVVVGAVGLGALTEAIKSVRN